MRNLLVPFLAVAVLGLATAARSQCSVVPGTGCPGQGAPVCGTPPVIGTNFIVRCAPSCFPSIAQTILIGVPSSTPFVFPFPPACTPGCVVACLPVAVISGPGVTLAIPNNPSLIGLTLCMQCACQSLTGCINITQMMLFTIM